MAFETVTNQALAKWSSIITSFAPSKTGVLALNPNILAAQPKCVSIIWPRFILLGTPIGLRIISIGVPSSRYGMSSLGSTLETTPLFPCLPAILSPCVIFLVWAIQTLTIFWTPGNNWSPFSLVSIFTSITFPCWPWGTLNELSLTSLAFSPKMALSNFSSAVNSVSPFGVIFPTKISPWFTLAPILTIPSWSRLTKASSPTFGISLVISSGPSLVSLASISCFSICTEVNLSFLTKSSFNTIESS